MSWLKRDGSMLPLPSLWLVTEGLPQHETLSHKLSFVPYRSIRFSIPTREDRASPGREEWTEMISSFNRRLPQAGHSLSGSGSPALGVSLERQEGRGLEYLRSLPEAKRFPLYEEKGCKMQGPEPSHGLTACIVGHILPKWTSACLSLTVSHQEAGSQDSLCHWLPIRAGNVG